MTWIREYQWGYPSGGLSQVREHKSFVDTAIVIERSPISAVGGPNSRPNCCALHPVISDLSRKLSEFELSQRHWMLIATLQDGAPVRVAPFVAIEFSLDDLSG